MTIPTREIRDVNGSLQCVPVVELWQAGYAGGYGEQARERLLSKLGYVPTKEIEEAGR